MQTLSYQLDIGLFKRAVLSLAYGTHFYTFHVPYQDLFLLSLAGQQLYIAEWLLWPPAQFINFYFLPTRYRVLYDNTVSLVYDVYTSHVQNGPCC